MEDRGAHWRTSTYSTANGGQCIEVGTAPWRTSSHSGRSGGQCVEVAAAHRDRSPGARLGRTIMIRDTTDRTGPVLRVSAETWQAFTATLR